MELEVLKFGGSSLETAAAMRRVADVLWERRSTQRIVVCSAMGGITNALLDAGRRAAARDEGYKDTCSTIRRRHEEALEGLGVVADVEDLLHELEQLCSGIFLIGELSGRSSDALVSYGERLAVRIVEALLRGKGLAVRRVDARDWVATDAGYGAAWVDVERTAEAVRAGVTREMRFDVLLTEGFIGRAPDGSTTTLGRGGSDYTASLVAAAIGAVCMEKSTDVPGMMTADPRLVREARIIPSMSYEEAMELCHFGAKVIYHPTIAPLRERSIPLVVRSTFDPGATGTRIVADPPQSEVVRGISSISGMALLTLVGGGVIGRPGFSRRVFTALGLAGVNVVLITQSSSEHSITVAIAEQDVAAAEDALHEELGADLALGRLEPLRVDRGLSIVALVGGGMAATSGVSGRAFSALGSAGINVRAIAQGSTERNISIVVATEEEAAAVRALHGAFFTGGVRRLHLCCVGVGAVGSALLDQIAATAPALQAQGVELRVVGLASSTRSVLDPHGIDLSTWREALDGGEPGRTPAELLAQFRKLKLTDAVWVDNTASADVAACARTAVAAGIHVVCSNKIAAAGPLEDFHALAAGPGRFLNETNVGAALPVIDTLRTLVATGDRIRRIEAVMSGSLNHIFSRFGAGCSFEEAVLEARALGFTEPDPRLDLGGVDVARKLLILARMAGESLEMADISNPGFLPSSAFEGSVEAFLAALPSLEPGMQERLAAASPGRLRFVARWDREAGASVGLETLPSDHPFCALQGSDNRVSFTTDRYPERPLVIQGSGAGAAVTASGVFGDLLKLAR